jgi:hypothetical protein
MAGGVRVLGFCRVGRVAGVRALRAVGVVSCLVSAACTNLKPQPLPDDGGSGGFGGVSSAPVAGAPPGSAGASTGGAVGGVAGGGFGFENLSPTCTAPAGRLSFDAPGVDPKAPARRELFAWVSDERALAIRQDPTLLGSPAAPDLTALEALHALAALPAQPAAQLTLAQALQLSFASPQSAWPEPWANRLRRQGEQPGTQPVRIVLAPNAWVAVLENTTTLRVLDLNNVEVPLVDAAAAPERIGAIYHVNGMSDGCSFGSGADGYRQFVVGNSAMVQEWSLQTQAIEDRVASDIEQLSRYLVRVRTCPVNAPASFFNSAVLCNWQNPGVFKTPADTDAYVRGLALPSQDYLISAGELATLIDLLRGDLLEPDPVVFTKGGAP